MGYYSKNIAVIRELKSGFSANGGALSGLVKTEKYGGRLKVEVSLINFAPLSEGRYVTAVSDGKNCCILDGTGFEGVSEVDTGSGFAALICFVNGAVSPVASAVCGNFQSAAIGLRERIEETERVNLTKKPPDVYEDEALAEENYYEYEQTVKDGGAVREDTQKKADGRESDEDEAAAGAFKGGKGAVEIPLARGGCFYGRMKGEIEEVLSNFPAEEKLEGVIENSRWVKIDYGDGKFYVFGVIYGGGKPQYICYGVPSNNPARPPESLSGLASFIPSEKDGGAEGFWVMYQDAATGASVKITAE